MAADDENWRTQQNRQNVIARIDLALQSAGEPPMKYSAEMENCVFEIAKTKEQYHRYVEKVIDYLSGLNENNLAAGAQGAAGQGVQDPTGV
ncbi:mediator of RNA polymerase II transcription subunit 15-like [Microplitis mediator]|uniref:mediator of RNA polymerase II transcription subunit 15-like n=1 Tax=Microplitis mediator TaxID=375433 RepID=UPI002552B9CA|nr:mediator of RNA polymerase II transcription subunit 15-like [Microplitis mediator]